MPNILDEIIQYKKLFLEQQKRVVPLADLKSRSLDVPPPPAFLPAIHRGSDDDLNVIAECKKASPTKGVICEDYDPVRIALGYAEAGAAAISILTDEHYFKGGLPHLRAVRAELDTVPLLRKDFIVEEYQVYEAREAGAAAILLIAGILDRFQIADYRELARDLGMDALTEVHSEKEADFAAEHGARIIGVNNRDLTTFEVDIRQTEKIMRLLRAPAPGFVFVAESGISSPHHVDYLRQLGVDAMLIGEHFMKQPNPGEALARLLDHSRDEEAVEMATEEAIRRLGPSADLRRLLRGDEED